MRGIKEALAKYPNSIPQARAHFLFMWSCFIGHYASDECDLHCPCKSAKTKASWERDVEGVESEFDLETGTQLKKLYIDKTADKVIYKQVCELHSFIASIVCDVVHGFHTCGVESCHNSRTKDTPKRIECSKSFGHRALLWVLRKHLGYTFIYKVMEDLGVSVSDSIRDRIDHFSDLYVKRNTRMRTEEYKHKRYIQRKVDHGTAEQAKRWVKTHPYLPTYQSGDSFDFEVTDRSEAKKMGCGLTAQAPARAPLPAGEQPRARLSNVEVRAMLLEQWNSGRTGGLFKCEECANVYKLGYKSSHMQIHARKQAVSSLLPDAAALAAASTAATVPPVLQPPQLSLAVPVPSLHVPVHPPLLLYLSCHLHLPLLHNSIRTCNLYTFKLRS